jgi:Calcineurin-like phosphoesterase
MIGEEPELAMDQVNELEGACARTEALPDVSAPETNGVSLEKPAPVPVPAIEDVHDIDWNAVRDAVSRSLDRSRMRATVEGFEALLDQAGGPGLLFDGDRADAHDQAIQVGEVDPTAPLWIIGDLHGDLLALEAALALIGRWSDDAMTSPPNIVLLGDLFDDDGLGLELLLRVFDLILASPGRICVVVGNHDEALSYEGSRFASSVSPGDFAEFLNANIAHEWIERAGKLAVRFFEQAPHALFLPDGLLIAHAGFPLTDLHARLEQSGNWNDPACLSDFTWTRAHPTARKKMPNRFTRGSQFGREDFAAFCELSTRMGRPVTHLVRGHDHAEDRYITYPAYTTHPMLTTVALSRRLPRESSGPYERVPTLARYISRSLPQLFRLHIPPDLINSIFPHSEPAPDRQPAESGL